MNRFLSIIMVSTALLCIVHRGYTQQKNESVHWHDPAKERFLTLHNQQWTGSELERFYDRFPVKAQQTVRKEVWNLSRNSAGLKVVFRTDADKITVRYTTTNRENYGMPHFPSTGVSGIDLFVENMDRSWAWTNGTYDFRDTITYTFSKLELEKEKYLNGRVFHLFLPLYNSVAWMEIGVDSGKSFAFIPKSDEKPVVVYGTSIAQGGCASRPGMAWTNILERNLRVPVVNLGFSGNGRLEKEVIDLLVEKQASVFVLDCLPNLGKEVQHINAKLLYAVHTIRSKHPNTPIILTDHSAYVDGRMNSSVSDRILQQNEISHQTCQYLHSNGDKNIFCLTHTDIGLDMYDSVDGVHPTDMGMMKYAKAYEKLIREIIIITESKQ